MPVIQDARDLVAKADRLLGAGSHAEAMRAYKAALEQDAENVRALHRLAILLIRMQRQQDALPLMVRAVDLWPDNAGLVEDLSVLLDSMGRFEEGEAHALQAVALDHRRFRAQSLVAGAMARRGEIDRAIDLLLPLAESDLTPARGQTSLWRQLARFHDRKGDAEGAIQAIGSAQRAFCCAIPDAPERAEAFASFVRRCADHLDATTPSGTPLVKHVDVQPPQAFIFGFPRSGTTLLESMLARAEGVSVTEEDQYLHHMLMGLPKRLSAHADYPECVNLLPQDDIAALRDEYWRAQRHYFDIDASTSMHVDKSPLNLIHLAAIRRLFPEARIIMVLRDPRDVCLSCQMQAFHDGQAVHHHSIESTARLFDEVMRLWTHVRTWLDVPWREIRYEKLVTEPEDQMRSLVEFLGLPWSERLLDSEGAGGGRAIRTPSAAAVRSIPHARAVGRWRGYESFLTPVLPTIERYASHGAAAAQV